MKEKDKEKETYKYNYKTKMKHVNSGSNAIYGWGLVAALFYYLQHVTTYWDGVIGIIKALLWPAFLLFKVFTLIKM
jgi:hypothetical protein